MKGKETTDDVDGCNCPKFGFKMNDPLYKEFFNAVESLVMNSSRTKLDLPGLKVRYERLGNHYLSDCSLEIRDEDKELEDGESYHLGLFIEKDSFKDYDIEEIYVESVDRESIEKKMKGVIDNYSDIEEEYRSGFSPTEYPEF